MVKIREARFGSDLRLGLVRPFHEPPMVTRGPRMPSFEEATTATGVARADRARPCRRWRWCSLDPLIDDVAIDVEIVAQTPRTIVVKLRTSAERPS